MFQDVLQGWNDILQNVRIVQPTAQKRHDVQCLHLNSGVGIFAGFTTSLWYDFFCQRGSVYRHSHPVFAQDREGQTL
jgi:hypothetical protein